MRMVVEEDGIKKFIEAMAGLKLGTQFFDKVGAIIAGDIIGNIEAGTQADGSPIQSNAKSTIDKKKRQGNSPIRSLIDVERRFVRRGRSSWTWHATSKGVTLEPTNIGKRTPLREIVGYVQEKGYRGWFGISKKGRKAIGTLLKLKMQKILKQASR